MDGIELIKNFEALIEKLYKLTSYGKPMKLFKKEIEYLKILKPPKPIKYKSLGKDLVPKIVNTPEMICCLMSNNQLRARHFKKQHEYVKLNAKGDVVWTSTGKVLEMTKDNLTAAWRVWV